MAHFPIPAWLPMQVAHCSAQRTAAHNQRGEQQEPEIGEIRQSNSPAPRRIKHRTGNERDVFRLRVPANRKSDRPAVKWLKDLFKPLEERVRPYVDEITVMKASTIGRATGIDRED